MPACPHRVRPPIDDIHTTALSAVVRPTPHLSADTPQLQLNPASAICSLNLISDEEFSLCLFFFSKENLLYSLKVYFKAGDGERNVAVWWTMVIAGRYRADDGGFYGKLSVGRLFQNAPTYRPVTHWCAQETKCWLREGSSFGKSDGNREA